VIVAAGLDLSLTGLGAVAVPENWDLDWRRVERASFGVSLPRGASTRQVTDRLRNLTRDVRVWLIRMHVTHVFIEDLPTHAAFSIVPLAELRGVVRLDLLDEAHLDVTFVNQSSARKLLLGKLPGKDRKAHVVEALKAAGAEFEDKDQYDAFAAVNARLGDLGIPQLKSLLWDPDAPKVKAPRAKKAKAA
jgi:Holliday junction resolvasome RuvABC endonuclease subunit